jgi:drug/metabolite transporter (DMT)-like permease
MDLYTILGIASGLWAAFFQSLSYLATRHFVHVRSGGTRTLIVLAHLFMGAVSFAILPFVLPPGGIPWHAIALPLFGTAFFYLIGQMGVMLALRHAQPSQVAPMLALKLLVLASLTVVVKHQHILSMQWVAIGCCLAGTFVLNYSSDRLPSKALAVLLATCFFFALSDWSITYLIPAFHGIPLWQQVMNASLLCYGFCGLVAIPFLPWYGSRKISDWIGVVPFSGAWMVAMVGLFTCFAQLGVVYGNILQSTRSVMGVFLAALLTYLGHTHIEHMRDRTMFVRRLAAAVLMTLAALLWFAKPLSASVSSPPHAEVPTPLPR